MEEKNEKLEAIKTLRAIADELEVEELQNPEEIDEAEITREQYIAFLHKSRFDDVEAEKMADYALLDFGSYTAAYDYYRTSVAFTIGSVMGMPRYARRLTADSDIGSDNPDASDINLTTVRWFDGYMEEFPATEVRFGSDLLFMRLNNGQNRHVPLRGVRWFSMSKESHQKLPEETAGDE